MPPLAKVILTCLAWALWQAVTSAMWAVGGGCKTAGCDGTGVNNLAYVSVWLRDTGIMSAIGVLILLPLWKPPTRRLMRARRIDWPFGVALLFGALSIAGWALMGWSHVVESCGCDPAPLPRLVSDRLFDWSPVIGVIAMVALTRAYWTCRDA